MMYKEREKEEDGVRLTMKSLRDQVTCNFCEVRFSVAYDHPPFKKADPSSRYFRTDRLPSHDKQLR
jgi:hypothetical protein